MISETKFAQHHTSTWRLLTPALDLFVRRINLDLYQREFPVLQSDVVSSRRGLINEISFNIYSLSSERERDFKWDDETLAAAIHRARCKIARIESIPLSEIMQPDEVELADCAEQVRRLRMFFSQLAQGSRVEAQPQFPGAGFLDSCEGDIYIPGILFEIKAGQRPYKSVDLKQLLTYAALNYAAESRSLDRLGLFNPRMGTSFIAPIDNIALEISGCSAIELLQEIVRIISSGDVSR
jgi:hypothetical protein